jgi:transposase
MKNFLTPEEHESLKAQHRLERDKRVCYRINAILLANSGWGYKEISNVLFLSDETVKNHIQDYLSNQKLKPENGGSESKLNKTQTESLLTHLEQHCYLYAKDIVQYVKTTFGIAYTVPGMICWLKSHGFSYKKPAIVPGKAKGVSIYPG